jgi:hypothetical protein
MKSLNNLKEIRQMTRTKSYMRARIESFNASLPPTANWGLQIVYQNGFISV